MTRTALVNTSNFVQDICIAGSGYTPPAGVTAVASATANIGDVYNPSAGTFTTPVIPPTQAQLQAYAGSKVSALIANMRSYTSGGVTLKSDATPATLANLMALQQWGTANGTSSQNWVADDYSVTAITGAEFVTFAPMVGAYAQSVYAELATVLGQIAANTIATNAQVDIASWPV